MIRYKDAMDCYTGGRHSQFVYESTSVAGSYNVKFSLRASNSRDVYYSFLINNSENIFGCVGLRSSKYCILNKQYSKDEYESLVGRIMDQMVEAGEYGEFFPISLSPFAYNETVAQEYFPMDESKVEAFGARWRPRDEKEYQPSDYQVPDSIETTSDDILNQVLACEETGKNYQITLAELKFYRKQNISIPRLCPDQRHKKRFDYKHR